MGEKMGLLFSIFVLGVIVFPVFLDMWVTQNNSSQLSNVTTEMQQLVSTEGGVTNTVRNRANKLKAKGATITFKDSSGKNVSGKQNVGSTINIHYSYSYKGIFVENTLETSNAVTVNKR